MEVLEIFNGLLEPAGMADPYPLYAALHEHGPMRAANEQLVLVPGYELASSVLRDSAFRVPDAELLDEVNPSWRDHPRSDPNSMLTLNGDPHSRIGSLFSRAVHQAAQSPTLTPAVIAQTDALLDKIADLGAGRRSTTSWRSSRSPCR